MRGTVLILGSSGRFGRHAAEAFWNAGWQVKIFDRARDNLMDEARGADVIVNGWNPAYPDWANELPGLTAQVIKAAEASGATILQPANIYVYGADAPDVLAATTPHNATNPLGRLRIEMERALTESSAQVILLRAGDYIDVEASGNWFDSVIAKPLGKGRLVSPGNADTAHSWAWLPDLARAAVDLCQRRDSLPAFVDVLFEGWTLSINDLAGIAAVVTGRNISVKRMNWLPIHLARPFWPIAKHLIEMRYLWSMPHRIDGSDMARLLPDFRSSDPACAFAPWQNQVEPDKPVARGGFDLAA